MWKAPPTQDEKISGSQIQVYKFTMWYDRYTWSAGPKAFKSKWQQLNTQIRDSVLISQVRNGLEKHLRCNLLVGHQKTGSSWKEWMALALELPPCFYFLGKNKKGKKKQTSFYFIFSLSESILHRFGSWELLGISRKNLLNSICLYNRNLSGVKMETKKIHAKHTPLKTQLETKHQTTQIRRMKQHWTPQKLSS